MYIVSRNVLDHAGVARNQAGRRRGTITRKPNGDRHNKPLPEEAVSIMQTWFDEHITAPYPNDADKREMAAAGHINVRSMTKSP
jgi:hypothetical protein